MLVKDDDSGKLVGEEKATRDATVQAGLEEITKAVGQGGSRRHQIRRACD